MKLNPVIFQRGRGFCYGLLLGGVAGLGAGWFLGFLPSSRHALEETKLCGIALRLYSSELHPQTREYLKARLYSNAAFWVSPSWMEGILSDYGPVDDIVLKGVPAIKGDVSNEEVYQLAMEKNGIPRGSP
jgi:hypothetical protein